MRKIFLTLALTLTFTASVFAADDVKKADLAGSWYPGSAEELKTIFAGYMKDADPGKIDGDIFAVISPHAGYQFSGPVAAYGFKALEAGSAKTVIVIGFSHRKAFDGISVYSQGAFETPLGSIPVDRGLAEEIISKDRRISFYPGLFKDEQSVEMQIPFIQYALKGVKIVPIAFGTQSYDDAVILAGALAEVLAARNDCAIVASTDLSHFHPYNEAKSIDERFIRILKTMKAKELYDQMHLGLCELCGIMPVTAVLLAAQKLGFDDIEVLKYANSGDTFGDKGRVVGYLSAVIYKKTVEGKVHRVKREEEKEGNNMLNKNQRARLLQIARQSIISYVKDGKRLKVDEPDPVLNRPMGAFVTLHESGELRGCIGNMVAQGPLCQTVSEMAVEAATGDPRFRTLTPQEIDKVDIEISALSPLRRVSSYKDIKIPGDGVLVRKGYASGVYLPQVATETGWTKEEFLTSLCGHKAGMDPLAWKDPATELYVFTAEVFGEKEAGL